MEYTKKITLCEVGLRDGLQSEKSSLSTDQKVELANDMVKAGFQVIELGSFVSPKAVPQMAGIRRCAVFPWSFHGISCRKRHTDMAVAVFDQGFHLPVSSLIVVDLDA